MPYFMDTSTSLDFTMPMAGIHNVYVTGESTREHLISVADDNNHGSSESSTKTVISWECGTSCGWGNNNKTKEATECLTTLYANIADRSSCNIRKFCTDMDKCTIRSSFKKGHTIHCYEHISADSFQNSAGCMSAFLRLRTLQPHFKEIRTLVRMIYCLKYYHKLLVETENSLNGSPHNAYTCFETLRNKNLLSTRNNSKFPNRPSLDEDYILQKFSKGINEFMKVQLNLPTTPTVCCYY